MAANSKALHLTGPALLFFRDTTFLVAGPASERSRSMVGTSGDSRFLQMDGLLWKTTEQYPP
jgi:hypothetical protein